MLFALVVQLKSVYIAEVILRYQIKKKLEANIKIFGSNNSVKILSKCIRMHLKIKYFMGGGGEGMPLDPPSCQAYGRAVVPPLSNSSLFLTVM